jgi:hypothetical protein
LGLIFAVATESPIYAIVWLSLILIVVLSLTGFLSSSMPSFYVWIMDINIMRFALLALLTNEFEGLEFTAIDGSVVVGNFILIFYYSLSFSYYLLFIYIGLDALPTNMKPSLSLISYIGILLGFLVFFRLILLICLVINEKENPYQYILNILTFGMIENNLNNEYNSITNNENKDENKIELNKIDVIIKD